MPIQNGSCQYSKPAGFIQPNYLNVYKGLLFVSLYCGATVGRGVQQCLQCSDSSILPVILRVFRDHHGQWLQRTIHHQLAALVELWKHCDKNIFLGGAALMTCASRKEVGLSACLFLPYKMPLLLILFEFRSANFN